MQSVAYTHLYVCNCGWFVYYFSCTFPAHENCSVIMNSKTCDMRFIKGLIVTILRITHSQVHIICPCKGPEMKQVSLHLYIVIGDLEMLKSNDSYTKDCEFLSLSLAIAREYSMTCNHSMIFSMLRGTVLDWLSPSKYICTYLQQHQQLMMPAVTVNYCLVFKQNYICRRGFFIQYWYQFNSRLFYTSKQFIWYSHTGWRLCQL